jgi:hypothetical protein
MLQVFRFLVSPNMTTRRACDARWRVIVTKDKTSNRGPEPDEAESLPRDNSELQLQKAGTGSRKTLIWQEIRAIQKLLQSPEVQTAGRGAVKRHGAERDWQHRSESEPIVK